MSTTRPDPALRTDVSIGRLDGILTFRLRLLQQRLAREMGDALRRRDMRPAMLPALEIIRANPGISQQDLSDVVGFDKSVTVQVVDLLEEGGLAERRHSGADRRRHALFATPAGEARLGELLSLVEGAEAEVFRGIDAGERRHFFELLDRLGSNLHD